MADSPIKFDDLAGFQDPLLSFKWICEELPSFGSGMKTSYVEEVSIPFPNIQQKEGVFHAGTYSYYPGYETIDAFDVTFYEDRSATSLKYLESWKSKIRNNDNGTFYLPTSYKRSMKFGLYDQKNTKIALITMYNCWPTSRGNLALSYTSSDRIKIQQNFSVDGQRLEFLV